MVTYREQLETLKPIKLREGETKRVQCPFCGGKGTFTISRREGLTVWNCYKASCDASGSKGAEIANDTIRRKLNGLSGPSPIAPKTPLPVHTSDPKNHKKSIDYLSTVGAVKAYEDGTVRVRYDPREDRVLFYNQSGLGAVGRSLSGRKPKWKVYGDCSELFTVGKGRTAVVVEDAASASAVSQIEAYTGCSLLGTSLTSTHKAALVKFERVVIALDQDASVKALQLQRRLEGRTLTQVRLLTEDLKYLTADQIVRLIR